VREGDQTHEGCAVVISNADADDVDGKTSEHSVRMNVGSGNAGKAYRPFSGGDEKVDIGKDGWGVFTCKRGSLRVWVREA